MLDCYEIRQGMIFYVQDTTSSENVIFKGEHTPKKRRPWIVVSNDKNNMFSPNISMVPIYTRTDTTLPTQVHFKNGNREQVACCESVTCVPKDMIDMKGYVGIVSTPVFSRIQKALSVQFSTAFEDTPSELIKASIGKILDQTNVESLITSKFLEILMSGLSTINVPETKLPTGGEIGICSETTVSNTSEPIITEPEPINKDNESVEKKTRKRRSYGPRGNTMSLENCLEFYTDTDTMSVEELYEKWKTFGVKNDKTEVSKKKWSIKQRLKKEGLL